MLRFAPLVLVACTGAVDGAAPDAPAVSIDATQEQDNAAVARAQLWVDAKVPYCQAPNHAHDDDADCASTCTRPDNPEWDPYRSDCSGLVSWAWGLPAPGHTTATFAPFDTTVSHAISAIDLQPGDAINNDHHTMLFARGSRKDTQARFHRGARRAARRSRTRASSSRPSR